MTIPSPIINRPGVVGATLQAPLWFIQIIRWSRSLCVIIEAHEILRTFWILKDIWNLDIFDQEPKYAYALFACVLRFYVFSWNILHPFYIDMLQMSFTHEERPIWSYTCNVSGKKFKIKWYMKKHYQKNSYIVLVPSQRYQDFWQLSQNQKFLRLSWASVI